MSTPADMADPANEPMDYVLHKLRRGKMRQLQREEQALQEAEADIAESSTLALTDQPVSVVSSEKSPTTQRRKGILKPPTVRFAGDAKDSNSDIDDSAPKRSDTFVPVFLPPAPPAPLDASHHDGPPIPPPPPMGPPEPLDLFLPSVDENAYINRAAYNLYTKFMDELSEFVNMQGVVIRSRVAVQERRVELKLYRENVSKCDIEFMDHLRHRIATGITSDDTDLERLFQAAQTARDHVGPREDDYEDLENKLGAEEFALREKYSSLESRYENFFKLRANSTTKLSAPSTFEFQSSSAPSDPNVKERDTQEPRQYAKLYGAYIGDDKVKVGQLPLEGDSAEVTDGPLPAHGTQRAISGLTASSDPEKQHSNVANEEGGDNDDAPTTDDFLGREIPHFDFDSLDHLMTESLKGISDLLVNSEIPEHLLDELTVDPSFEEAENLLLRENDSDTQSTLSDYLLNFDSTRNRVNRWLLHKLRSSPREVFELQRQIAESSPLVPDWANLALGLWDTDGTHVVPASQHAELSGFHDTRRGLRIVTNQTAGTKEAARRYKRAKRLKAQGSIVVNAPALHEPAVISVPLAAGELGHET